MKPPHGIDEIRRIYGDITVRNGVVLPRGWEDNCTLLHDLPLFKQRLYVHRLIEVPLRRALMRCAAYNVAHPDEAYRPEKIGCFAPRAKRSSGELSLHSWAVAVDIDDRKNPPIKNCPPGDPRRARHSFPAWWLDIWREEGWTWGGDFTGDYFDAMHFQFCSGY